MFSDVTILDWVLLAITAISAGVTWLARRRQLPAGVRKWLNRIGRDDILEAIKEAETFGGLTPDERRKRVVAKLQEITRERLGFEVPTSVANLLVELVYQTWMSLKK